MEEDIDPVLQDLQCSQVHTCCQAGDLQDLQDLQVCSLHLPAPTCSGPTSRLAASSSRLPT